MRGVGLLVGPSPPPLRIEHEHCISVVLWHGVEAGEDLLVLGRTLPRHVDRVDQAVAEVAGDAVTVGVVERLAGGVGGVASDERHRHVAAQAERPDIGDVLVGVGHLGIEERIAPGEPHQASGPGRIGLVLRVEVAMAGAAVVRGLEGANRDVADLRTREPEVLLRERDQRRERGGRDERQDGAAGPAEKARLRGHRPPFRK